MNRACASSRVLWEQTRESHIKTGKKKPLSDEDETMKWWRRRERIWTQKSNRAQVYPLSTSLPLSRITTRVVHLAQHQHSQKMRRVFFLSLTRAEASSSSKRDDGDDKRRPSKDTRDDDGDRKEEEENAPWKYSRFDSELPGCNKSTPPHSRRTRLKWPSLICRLARATR